MSNTKDALKHYGYPEDTPDKDVGIGLWDKSDALDRLAKLPEMLPHLDGNKKIRVVFDYDPDFPKALLQITGLPANKPWAESEPENRRHSHRKPGGIRGAENQPGQN